MNKVNKYGGERAKCPKCGKYNDELYQWLKGDWRDLKCSECGESSVYMYYFPNEIEKLKEENKRKLDNSTEK